MANGEAIKNGNGGALSIKTGFGEIAAKGTTVFIVLALFGLTGVSVYEHRERQHEHEAIECTLQLNLYFQTIPRGTQIVWNDIPSEYWRCLPPTLVDKGKTLR